MIKLIITGSCGRMGRRLVCLATESEQFKVVGATEKRNHPNLEEDIGEICGIGRLNVPVLADVDEAIDKADAIIDFTSPSSTLNNIRAAKAAQKPIVIGTTGLMDEELDIIKAASKSVPILVSPNMSIGINVLLDVVGTVARNLGEGYDIEIIETHHNQKKDAPSGTAKRLAKEILDAKGRKYKLIYGREGNVGKRPKNEIGIHAVRAGDIVGEHVVIFSGQSEKIEIVHKAHSRDVFARGALRAAKFIIDQSPGLYTMEDVLKEL